MKQANKAQHNVLPQLVALDDPRSRGECPAGPQHLHQRDGQVHIRHGQRSQASGSPRHHISFLTGQWSPNITFHDLDTGLVQYIRLLSEHLHK